MDMAMVARSEGVCKKNISGTLDFNDWGTGLGDGRK